MHFRRRQQVTTAGLRCRRPRPCRMFVVESRRAPPRRGASSASASSSSAAPLSGTLNGSGSTFQTVYQQTAIQSFRSVQPGMTVNYGSGGSGKGRTDLASGVVNYAGSDSPIPSSEASSFAGKTVLYFPVFLGPITVSYNLSGVSNLKLDATVLADIFQGKITILEQLGDHGAQPGRQPAQHPDHPRRPLGLLGHHAELLLVPGERRRAARGRSAAARPSSGPPPPGPATATPGWRRSSSPPPGPSATWTTPTPRPPD